MDYQEKLDSVRLVLNEHNKALEGTSHQISIDHFFNLIKIQGGTTSDRLKQFSYEDILDCFPEFDSVKPKILAKEIAKIFRGKEEKKTKNRLSASRMTLQELIENFDPEDHTSPIGKRLSDISKFQPFLVYDSNNNVEIETSLKLIDEIKKGYPGREIFEDKKVYKIGEIPNYYVDQNPIWTNRALRPDLTCDQLNRSWNGVSLEIRQLILIASTETKELTIDHDKAHNIMDIALSPDAFDKLKQRCPKAFILFEEKRKTGNLPKMKMLLNKNCSSSNNPFKNGKKIEFNSHLK